VKADLHRVSQVLYNLVGNACKFTSKGTIAVHAKLVGNPTGTEAPAAGEDASNWILVSVTDTGGGISAEDIPKLFKEFGQANNDHARQFAGTGLGLSICKELVELHGGQIWVKSTLGSGATFAFTLPATLDAAAADDGGDEDYTPSTDTLEMFGGLDPAGTWGTGSFRYGTGGTGNGSFLRLLSESKVSIVILRL
jgi:two-component system sensor histidine kinase ChiS